MATREIEAEEIETELVEEAEIEEIHNIVRFCRIKDCYYDPKKAKSATKNCRLSFNVPPTLQTMSVDVGQQIQVPI